MLSAAWRRSTGGRCEPMIGQACGTCTHLSRVLHVNQSTAAATKFAANQNSGVGVRLYKRAKKDIYSYS